MAAAFFASVNVGRAAIRVSLCITINERILVELLRWVVTLDRILRLRSIILSNNKDSKPSKGFLLKSVVQVYSSRAFCKVELKALDGNATGPARGSVSAKFSIDTTVLIL